MSLCDNFFLGSIGVLFTALTSVDRTVTCSTSACFKFMLVKTKCSEFHPFCSCKHVST